MYSIGTLDGHGLEAIEKQQAENTDQIAKAEAQTTQVMTGLTQQNR
jgi:hypothetical protein